MSRTEEVRCSGCRAPLADPRVCPICKSTDIVTCGEIVESFSGGLRRLLTLADDPSKLETYIRRSLANGHDAAVRISGTPVWERAFAHVLKLQDFVRWLDGRVEDGRIDYTVPDEPSKEHTAYLKALTETELGYVHDPSWTNGGIASHGAETEVPDLKDPEQLRRAKMMPELRGVAVYGKVVQVAGIPEVAWNYSAGACQLGISSIQDGVVMKMLIGSEHGETTSSSPAEPTDDQIHAAAIHRRVRERLGKLPHHAQGVLELSYSDRRYSNDVVVEYGVGCAPIVWRAACRAREVDDRGCALVGAGTLRELVDEVRLYWPTYDAGSKGTLRERVGRAADLLLWTVHTLYALASEKPPHPRKEARRRALAALSTRQPKKRRRRSIAPARKAA